jgi:hypothetical protein
MMTRIALGQPNWFIQIPLLLHVAGGVAGTVTGFVALSVTKGAPLHKRTGVAFVGAMLLMGLVGAAIAAYEGNVGSVIGGLMTAYLVVTAMTTMRETTPTSHRIDIVAMSVALTMGGLSVLSALARMIQGVWLVRGVPVMVSFIMGAIVLSAGLSDVRIVRHGALRGLPRLVRHLWRMCFGLFIASGSFFLGQAHVIPKAVRYWPALWTLAFLPLGAMLYWLWRIRVRHKLRGLIIRVGAPEPA